MQTFLPYADFERSARSLDPRRLGKQRVEGLQVLRGLTRKGYGWCLPRRPDVVSGETDLLVLGGELVGVTRDRRAPDSVTRVTAGTAGAPPASAGARLGPLLTAAHGPPALAVTVLAGLLSVAAGHESATTLLVLAAVLTGQLTIGWSNDLVDLGRDRAVGRTDKPLVTGALPVPWVRTACTLALVATVPLSLLCGVGAGALHLTSVAAGWAYNLGLKRTWWSWLPYAIAFGALPAFVSLAGPDGEAPPWWWPVAGALLGVGAHLLNVLPDLADDAATDVRGFPHRLGPQRIPGVAAAVLLGASAAILVGAGVPLVVGLVTGVVLLALGTVVVTRAGKVPFVAAVGIALVDVVLLVAAR